MCASSFSCNRNNKKYLENYWIVDTGATNHMTHDPSCLITLRKLMSPIQIILPDGSVQRAIEVGTIHLTTHMLLHDVFYVPEFKYHLLSVQQLLREHGFHTQLQ